MKLNRVSVLVLGACCAVFLCLNSYASNTQSSATNEKTSLVIRDSEGAPRIRLGRLSSGLYGLQFLSSAGETAGELSMADDGSFKGLLGANKEKGGRISLKAGSDGSAEIALLDRNRQRAALALKSEGESEIALKDEVGETRLKLSCAQSGRRASLALHGADKDGRAGSSILALARTAGSASFVITGRGPTDSRMGLFRQPTGDCQLIFGISRVGKYLKRRFTAFVSGHGERAFVGTVDGDNGPSVYLNDDPEFGKQIVVGGVDKERVMIGKSPKGQTVLRLRDRTGKIIEEIKGKKSKGKD